GRRRILKPYSLQRIRDGHILLFAQDPGGTNIKSFRIDRIEAVAFQKIPFQPRYTVEFSSEAAITSRPVRGRIGQ
ncbi:MAG: WYL domain-containing protein, partial [Planctomycetota bacterium]